ncbi:hypothetical protein PUN28_001826 [Cardiocondyla obscurior]
MAYASLSQLSSTGTMSTTGTCPNDEIKPTLSEVLQSDSVKRLFSRSNLIIKTIALKQSTESNKVTSWCKKNGVNITPNTRPSDLPIVSTKTIDEEKEEAIFLPSKVKHKKSEIALIPIEKKSCGHYEQCENIVCDVILQQFVDEDGISPILSSNIDEDEINAPVGKHCENKNCDTLSIDHDRCRRGLIKLYRCDKSLICDICGIAFKEHISRIYHSNCERKNEYIHNNVDRMQLQKKRMRMRELQILEIAKMKKHNYSDPAKAIEILRKNEELIIIPQTVSSQQPIVTATSVSSTQPTNLNPINVQDIKINSQITKVTNIFGSVPFTVSSQSTVISTNTCSESKIKSVNQIRFSNLNQDFQLKSTSIPTTALVQAQTQVSTTSTSVSAPVPVLTPVSSSVPTLTLALAPAPTPIPAPVPTLSLTLAPAPTATSASTSTTISVSTSVPTLTLTLPPTSALASVTTSTSAPTSVTTSTPTVSSHKQYIRLAIAPQSANVQSIPVNNWIISPSHILATSLQPKGFLTPIRVIPITNLTNSPPILPRTQQDIPKFCIVPGNLIKPIITPKPSSIQPANPVVDTTSVQVNTSNLWTDKPMLTKRKTPKVIKTKKNFFCNYCSKNITTDWYFKMHIAKHKGEKLFFCTFCDESFSNNYDMRKHVTNQHTDQKELVCDKCNYTCMSLTSFKNHVQTHAVCGLNKADVQSKKRRKLEASEDKVNHKLIHNTYKRKIKKIKCKDTSNSQKERVEKHNSKESLMVNIGKNTKNKKKKFNNVKKRFVSVKKIVEPENFNQDSTITSR